MVEKRANRGVTEKEGVGRKEGEGFRGQLPVPQLPCRHSAPVFGCHS